jgi:transposase
MGIENELRKIIQRLDGLEKRLLSLEKTDGKNLSAKRVALEKDSLPNLIINLRGQSFFKTPRTSDEVHHEISPKYSCDLNRVTMALSRLKKRKKLRISSKVVKNRKISAYVW